MKVPWKLCCCSARPRRVSQSWASSAWAGTTNQPLSKSARSGMARIKLLDGLAVFQACGASVWQRAFSAFQGRFLCVLAQVAWKTLILPAGLPLKYTVGHRPGGLGAFLVAGQYGWTLDLRTGHDRLLGLLGQFGTGDFVLVVQTNTCQYSDGHRSSDCQTTQATPRAASSFCRNGFISQRSRNGRSNIQTRD